MDHYFIHAATAEHFTAIPNAHIVTLKDADTSLVSNARLHFANRLTPSFVPSSSGITPSRGCDRGLERVTVYSSLIGLLKSCRPSTQIKANARANAPRIVYALFLLKVVGEVKDPVMGSSQLSRIERQIRTIDATNIRVMNLLLVLYPFIGRLQANLRWLKMV
jgi:hypothetical protein